jgi:cell division protein FtsQ
LNSGYAMPRLPELPTLQVPRWLPSALMLVLIAAATIALVPRDAPLTQLELRGEFEHLSAQDVQAAAAPHLQTSFFAADVTALRDAVAALPWVASVRVQRQWPGVLLLRVTERKPFARWNDAALLDTESVAFTPRAGEVPVGLPRLGGSRGHEAEVAQTWQRLAPALSQTPMELLGLSLDARGEWSALTAKGVSLRFGQNPPDEKLPMLTGAVQKTIADRWEQVEYVDLRYTNGFAVGWREAEQATGGSRK